ncbi:hypothetical protein [Bifidobacterium simiarum]|uniref:hypothetical protein n=1 Tax=Bifidobacterium simiarum TaxID=2045441 RepID=UPI001BDCC6DF|nr:hypothetical protein [Bifidobacterium simiarum]MBT1167252.1 hypothetical protein [Bifidobacterium simiarum]
MRRAMRLDMSIMVPAPEEPPAPGRTEKVMTTFKMPADLKTELNAYCRKHGLRIGDWINQAIRERLERERRNETGRKGDRES